MRRTALLLPVPLVLSVLTALPSAAVAGPAADPAPTVGVAAARGPVVPGSYVVVLRSGADPRSVARAAGADARRVYRSVLHGFAAQLSPAQLDRVRRDPAVQAVEPDQVVRADAAQTIAAGSGLYGLDRSDQRSLPLSGSYTYASTGSGVQAYVVDTGLATAHPDLGGRARNVYDALGGTGEDCHGHGTHVAGTLGGATHGIAKSVQLRGVRVLGCDGSGSTSGVIAALDWLRTNAQRPAVANLSLGGSYSSALDTAVTSLSDSGVLVAVAAGNANASACKSSPASAAAAVTVAASDSTDTRASFSNYGSCVDLYAPGVGISSAWYTGGSRALSGTSMASPHVAGVAALYKATYGDAASSTVAGWLTSAATAKVVKSNPSGTPNRLLFKSGL